MSNNRRRNSLIIFGLLLIIFIAWITLRKQAGPIEPKSPVNTLPVTRVPVTATATFSMNPSFLEPTPTPGFENLPVTQIDRIKSVCLVVTATGDFEPPMVERVTEMLARVGVKTQVSGTGCDAQLYISTYGKSLSASYSTKNGSKTCYTGAELTANFSLEGVGVNTMDLALFEKQKPIEGIIFSCPGKSNPSYTWSFEKVVDRAMAFFWGAKVLTWDINDLAVLEEIPASVQGPRRAEALPYLLEIIRKKDETSPEWEVATRALGEIGAEAKEAIPLLLPASEKGNKIATLALARIGEFSVAPLLLELINDYDSQVQREARQALVALNPPDLLDILVKFSQDPQKEIYQQEAAIEVLLSMGPRAAPAVGGLIDFCIKDISTCERITSFIGTLRPVAQYADSATYAPKILADASRLSIFDSCALLLASFGGDVIPYLESELMADYQKSNHRFQCSVKAASYLADEAVPLVPALAQHLNNADELAENDLKYIIFALGEIGPGAIAAVPTLIRELGNYQHTTFLDVERTLNKITGKDFGSDARAWTDWWNGYVKGK